MCNPASFVLTKDRVFWSKKTDSHDKIINEYSLCESIRNESPATCEACTLKVEIVPPSKNAFDAPLNEWIFLIDQDIMPKWFDAVADEKRARDVLVEWAKSKLIRSGENRDVNEGDCILAICGGVVSEIRGGTVSKICGGTVSKIYGGTVSEICGGTVSSICGGTVSEICGGTVSLIWGGTVSSIYGGTVSKIYGGTVSSIFGGTVSKIYGGTVSSICGGVVSEICGGTVSKIWGGTVSSIWGGTVSKIYDGTVSKIYGGTVSEICGGTVSSICGGVVSEIRGGTVSKIFGGVVRFFTKFSCKIIGKYSVAIDMTGKKARCFVGTDKMRTITNMNKDELVAAQARSAKAARDAKNRNRTGA